MATTNTGADALQIARTALEASFGIMRALAKQGLLTEVGMAEVFAAAMPDTANLHPELTHHVRTRLDEVRALLAAEPSQPNPQG